MKKILILFLLFISLFIAGCKYDNSTPNLEQLADLVVEEINLPSETSENLNFRSSYEINGFLVQVEWIVGEQAFITTQGIISKGLIEQEVDIEIIVRIGLEETTRNLGKVLILPLTNNEILDFLKSEISIPDSPIENIILPNEIEVNGIIINLEWHSSNIDALSHEGIIHFQDEEQSSTLTVLVTYEETTFTVVWGDITIPKMTNEEYIESVLNSINIPQEITEDFNLPTTLSNVSFQWISSNSNILFIDNYKKKGLWKFFEEDSDVVLTAVGLYKNTVFEKQFSLTMCTIKVEDRFNLAFTSINIPEVINSNVLLPTVFDYGVTGEWTTNNPTIVNNNGFVFLDSNPHEIILTLKLYLGEGSMEKNYYTTTEAISLNENEKYIGNHYLVDRAEYFELDNNPNLKKENNKVVLLPHALEGTYESPVFKTNNFVSLVGSWAAITSTQATAELKIRIKVNNVWSNYLSYGVWGLGLNNAMNKQQTDSLILLNEDILQVKNNQNANAFQYTITLRRKTIQDNSPVLSLVAATLEIKDYTYPVNTSQLPKSIDYEIPKLYQIDVPGIGNSICSPTSSAMLLMYKGHQLEGVHPHERIANLFKDYGNNIFGNWVYNTVGMSAFGEDSYVKRIYSWEELQYHLVNVGPVALSIKGDTGRYTTNGHLIVVRGYETTEYGTKVICNDPNLKEVTYKYDLSTFLAFSRNVIYVVE